MRLAQLVLLFNYGDQTKICRSQIFHLRLFEGLWNKFQ
ncbi:hypothetical protein PG5_18600 [Pseudomonas sp. G5(2012)]|nr:hypothetical protein PG5_18600 [Pseudomonas sp. G5(2012)]